MPLIVGTAADDYVMGTPEDDTLRGLGGNDILNGGTGRDVMDGGAGNDSYFLDTAFDQVFESIGAGLDVVYANFTYALAAGQEIEMLSTGNTVGTNTVNFEGNEFNNVIVGNDGSGTLFGGAGDDYLQGNGGADILIGGTGRDIMEGGIGNDIYFVDTAFDIVRDAVGAGLDIVYSSVTLELAAGQEIEVLSTGNAAGAVDINFTGNEFNNNLVGNDGTNWLVGGAGDDYLEAYAGDDLLDGGTGADFAAGGQGNDIYYVDNVGDVVLELPDQGFDTVYASADVSLRAGQSIEVVSTGNARGLNPVSFTGNELNNYLVGNDATNALSGGGGDDYLEGHGGNDVLRGGAGNDILEGGAGNDDMEGGAGNDIYYVDSLFDVVREDAGAGLDTVYAAFSYSLSVGQEIEVLSTGSAFGTSDINLSGNELNNNLVGNDGVNILIGGAGNDYLQGHGGNDTLDGGADQDILVGGAGADLYRFSSAAHTALGAFDTINGFETGVDRIDLSLVDANSQTAAIDSFLFLGAQSFTGRAGELRYVQSGTIFDLYADRDGNGVADMHIRVNGNGLAMGDIIGAVAPPQSNRAPTITSSAASSVAENSAASTIVYQTVASDLDGDLISYRLTGADAALFSIDSSGSVRLLTPANFEARSSYNFTVVAEDGRGGSDDQAVTLSITNVNEAPVITSGATATIAENSPTSTIVYQTAASDPDGNALTYSLTGADAAFFTIDSSGAVRFVQSPNFEARSSYSLTVQASDGSLAATRAVTVTVTDVNESVGATPIIAETAAANDSIAAAQTILRSQLAVASNPNLQDQSLPSVQINGNISPLGDSDYFSITLQAGELLILDVDGTNSLDAFLRVFGPSGTLVAENDDAVSFDPGSSAHSGISHNLDSLIRFRASVDGTYTFQIRSFESDGTPTSSGAYTINLSIGPSVPQSVIDQENIDALIAGPRWTTSSVTYGFPTSPTQYPGSEGTPERDTNFETLNATQRAATVTTFGLVTQYTGLPFIENSVSPGVAQIRLAQSDEPDTAYAFYPGSGDGGDVWFRNSAPADAPTGTLPRYDNPVAGNYGYFTFLHEIGHALGLKHGHESPALSPDRNSTEFSVMTYSGYVGAPSEGGYRNEQWGFAQSFMMYDIAALQKIYGANFGTQSGNTTYSWSPTSGAFSIDGVVQWTPGGNRVFQTIWDGGGIDTYDLSNYSGGTTIDLRPGEWTTTSQVQLANLGNGNFARGNVANALLYNGDTRSLIENAIGGAGNDTLIANQAQNQLRGNAGADTFAWRSAGDAQTGNPDRILDFVQGVDKIDLSAIDAISGTSANDAFSFIGTNAFTGTAGQLRYAVDGNGVNVYADIDGNGLADLHFIVNGTSIAASDFLF